MTKTRFRPAIVAVAPLVLLIGFAYHPYVARPTNEVALAAAAASDTTRWGLSHLAIGVAYGLVVVAFIAIRSYLREAGEERWSALALPFIALGSAMFPILTGMEFALLTAGVSFALGAIGFAKGIADSKVLSAQLNRLVVGALVVMVVARFVPLGAAQPVIGAAGVVALWPLAYTMWKRPVAQPSGQS